MDSGRVPFEGGSRNSLYELPLQREGGGSILLVEKTLIDFWHKCLTHLRFDALDLLAHKECITVTNLYDPCLVSKLHKLPSPRWSIVYRNPLDFTDI